MALVLSRRVGETIVIGDDIEVTVAEVHGRQVRIAVEAPNLSIDRREVREKKLRNKRVA